MSDSSAEVQVQYFMQRLTETKQKMRVQMFMPKSRTARIFLFVRKGVGLPGYSECVRQGVGLRGYSEYARQV